VLITTALDGPVELASEAERAGVPLLRTALSTPIAIARLTNLLEDHLAPREIRHGVLLDILGLGVCSPEKRHRQERVRPRSRRPRHRLVPTTPSKSAAAAKRS
jgi:hypothetical protein